MAYSANNNYNSIDNGNSDNSNRHMTVATVPTTTWPTVPILTTGPTVPILTTHAVFLVKEQLVPGGQ
jgi:hypothetical protein